MSVPIKHLRDFGNLGNCRQPISIIMKFSFNKLILLVAAGCALAAPSPTHQNVGLSPSFSLTSPINAFSDYWPRKLYRLLPGSSRSHRCRARQQGSRGGNRRKLLHLTQRRRELSLPKPSHRSLWLHQPRGTMAKCHLVLHRRQRFQLWMVQVSPVHHLRR